MQESFIKAIIAILIAIFITSCAQNHVNPISTLSIDPDPEMFISKPSENTISRAFFGSWIVHFDTGTFKTSIEEFRANQVHFNVTQYIPAPRIIVNDYDPSGVIDVDVTITNPYPIDVYDVRLIIFTDDEYHMLLNPDCWTSLYDISEGYPINPFVAYAKIEPNRIFKGQSENTENLQVYLPQGNTDVIFAIDASYPGNCKEPYEINGFTQEILYDQQGESADIEISIFDWQNDVNAVYLYCPQITGVPLAPFTLIDNEKWGMHLVNNTGASTGEYIAYIMAKSTGSGSLALYDKIIITVSQITSGIPDNPQIAGTVYMMSKCVDVYFDGDYAFCACDDEGLKIMDISNPARPNIIGKVDNITAKYCAAGNGYAYVAAFGDGLIIVNISNPREPEIIGGIDTGTAFSVAVLGYFVFVADYSGLVIVDVHDPLQPEIIPHSLDLDSCEDIEIKENYAYIASTDFMSDHFFNVVDISDPHNPVLEDSVEILNLMGVEIEGDYAYLPSYAYNGGLIIYDISDPSNIEMKGQVLIENIQDVAVNGNFAYVTSYVTSSYHHLKIVDIHDPTTPQVISSVELYEPMKVAAIGNFAYVCDNISGLVIVDASIPTEPEVTFYYKIEWIQSVKIAGNYAYFACREEGMYIADISNPPLPKIIGQFDDQYYMTISAVDVANNYAYLVELFPGDLSIVDITNPSKPIEISRLYMGSVAWNIVVEGSYAFIPTESNGLKIVDISDPYNPQIKSSTYWGWTYDLVIDGDYAYVSFSSSAYGFMNVFDISDVTNPERVGYYDSYFGRGIDKQNNYVYLAHFEPCRFIDIIDVSDPTAPVGVAIAYTTHMAVDVDVQGNYAYIAGFEPAGGGGLEVVDITDPSAPVLFSSLPTDVPSTGIVVKDNYAYLGDADGGLKIIQLW